jgi:hypothetical protein
MPGEYVTRIYDKDNESDIYASGTFTVGAVSKSDYRSNSTFVACKSVNDDWEAVGETKKIAAGSCIQFLYKASKSMPPIKNYFVVWAIRKVKSDGSLEYVNDLLQNVGDNGWRYCATNDVCEFSKPGTYRVYLVTKENSDSMHGDISDNAEYFGKMEFTVE